MLLFELIFQCTATQKNLLIILDEPFAGVTDDFIPFILECLNKMREEHLWRSFGSVQGKDINNVKLLSNLLRT
jgi:hypothetical protein